MCSDLDEVGQAIDYKSSSSSNIKIQTFSEIIYSKISKNGKKVIPRVIANNWGRKNMKKKTSYDTIASMITSISRVV